MYRLFVFLLLMTGAACVKSETRFERLDQGQAKALPLKLVSVSGVRDGENVRAVIRFQDGQDSAVLMIATKLGPPPQFMAGNYQALMGGRTDAGIVECPSLAFLGGQNSMPSVGGVFILKDAQTRPLYRITMPATVIQRQVDMR